MDSGHETLRRLRRERGARGTAAPVPPPGPPSQQDHGAVRGAGDHRGACRPTPVRVVSTCGCRCLMPPCRVPVARLRRGRDAHRVRTARSRRHDPAVTLISDGDRRIAADVCRPCRASPGRRRPAWRADGNAAASPPVYLAAGTWGSRWAVAWLGRGRCSVRGLWATSSTMSTGLETIGVFVEDVHPTPGPHPATSPSDPSNGLPRVGGLLGAAPTTIGAASEHAHGDAGVRRPDGALILCTCAWTGGNGASGASSR